MQNLKTPKSFRSLKTSLLFLLFMSAFCFANPIAMPYPKRNFDFSFFEILGIDIVADFAVVFITLLIFREIKKINAFTFSIYMILVVIGGLIMDAISIFLAELLTLGKQDLFDSPSNEAKVLFILFSFALLFIYNYLLSKKMLLIETRHRFYLAIAIAVFTNPIICFAFLHYYELTY